MVVTPDTDIILLKCELKLDNKNQLTFSDATAQFNYFNGLDKLELENATYQRKDGAIRYDGEFDDLIPYNYCMYRNNNYSDKWFYAFIVDLQYLNSGCTLIHIATDVFQTWQFDLIYKTSFVEREHILNDTIGANLLPENLETGEYKIAGVGGVDNLAPVYVIAYTGYKIMYKETGDVTVDYKEYLTDHGNAINGIPQAMAFIATDSLTKYYYLMRSLVGWQEGDITNQSTYVVASFTVPKVAVNGLLTDANRLQGINAGDVVNNIWVLKGDATATTETLIARPSSVDGYIPHNGKVLTYPYLYIGFNPTQGANKVYRYEDFENATPSFKFISEANPNPTVFMIPQNYRGKTGDNLSDAATLNGYPTLSTSTDYYNAWLAENAGLVNVQTERETYAANMGVVTGSSNLLANALGMIAGAGSGLTTLGNMGKRYSDYNTNGGQGSGAGLGTASGFGSTVNAGAQLQNTAANYDFYIKELMATVERQKLLPDQATLGGSNATIVGYGLIDDNIFTRYNIKAQFAQRIDHYFDMFGYATNDLKVPNINTRPYWNYIKTQGINIEGDVPETDLAELRNLFDNGVTLWHDATKYLDYSQDNRPVTP